MRLFVQENGVRRPVTQMTLPQSKQAAAIMDYFGRLIPQEGVDYDVEITFNGTYSPSVSMSIAANTQKGEWWKRYALEMLKTSQPTVKNPEPSLLEETESTESEEQGNSHA